MQPHITVWIQALLWTRTYTLFIYFISVPRIGCITLTLKSPLQILLLNQGFRGVLKSLKFSYIKFKALKILKLYNKVLIMISRGLKFGDGKTRIAIWLNVTIKLQKAMKHERCTIKVWSCTDLCTALTGETVIFTKRGTCWQRMNVQFQ